MCVFVAELDSRTISQVAREMGESGTKCDVGVIDSSESGERQDPLSPHQLCLLELSRMMEYSISEFSHTEHLKYG